MNNNLTIDWILENKQLIHYFGLGFIQVKVNDSERYHFYDKTLPLTIEFEEIHNHRYNFVSTILKGELNNVIYDVDYNGQNQILTDETCNADIKSNSPELNVSSYLIDVFKYKENQKYYMDHNTFHTVYSFGDCITHLIRGTYKKDFAQVIRNKDKDLTCPFSIKLEEKELIERIETILKS